MKVHLVAVAILVAPALHAQQFAPLAFSRVDLADRTVPARSYWINETPVALACDNSALKAAESQKDRGNMIRLLGGGAAVVGGILATQSQNASSAGTGGTLLLGGLVTLIVGGHMQASVDQPAAMDQAIQSLSVGTTRATEVQNCLGKPSTTTSKSSGEEQWTYTVMKSSTSAGVLGYLLPIGSHATADMRSVTLTFKNGVLSDVSKTASSF